MLFQMTKTEQRQYVLERVRPWAGSDTLALNWFNHEVIPAIGCTPQVAIDRGQFEMLNNYIDIISLGGYA
jgi:hypothetical protein